MKQGISMIMELVLVAIVALVVLQQLFTRGISGKKPLELLGEIEGITMDQADGGDYEEILRGLVQGSEPEIHSRVGVYQVGEVVALRDLLTIVQEEKTSAEQWEVQLLRAFDQQGMSLEEGYLLNYEEDMESIQPLTYDSQTGTISFHQSGIYQLQLRLTGDQGGRQNVRLQIPVEAG